MKDVLTTPASARGAAGGLPSKVCFARQVFVGIIFILCSDRTSTSTSTLFYMLISSGRAAHIRCLHNPLRTIPTISHFKYIQFTCCWRPFLTCHLFSQSLNPVAVRDPHSSCMHSFITQIRLDEQATEPDITSSEDDDEWSQFYDLSKLDFGRMQERDSAFWPWHSYLSIPRSSQHYIPFYQAHSWFLWRR